MLSHVVAGLQVRNEQSCCTKAASRPWQAFDQIIVTEAADELPAIDGNLDGLGIRRRECIEIL